MALVRYSFLPPYCPTTPPEERMEKIAIGTLLRNIRDDSTIYLITDETDEYFVATIVGDTTGRYSRMFKDMSYDNMEVIA